MSSDEHDRRCHLSLHLTFCFLGYVSTNYFLRIGAINKAKIPSLLVSCKCDAPPEERDVNPRVVEQTAKRNVKDLDTLRVSAAAPQSHKQGVSMILRAIVSGAPDNGVEKCKNTSSRAHSHPANCMSRQQNAKPISEPPPRAG